MKPPRAYSIEIDVDPNGGCAQVYHIEGCDGIPTNLLDNPKLLIRLIADLQKIYRKINSIEANKQ